MSDSKFLISTLLFVTIIFTMVTLAHGLALIVKGDMQTYEQEFIINPDEYSTERQEDEQNFSQFDLSNPIDVLGSLVLGLDMPMPFPIIIIGFNAVCFSLVIYIVSEMIRKWIPLVSS